MENSTKSVFIKAERDSKEYDAFNLVDENRDVDNVQINRLVKSFLKYGTAALNLTVLESRVLSGKWEYYLGDGQHSIKACKQLNLPFNYTVVRLENETKESVLKYIATLNNAKKGWSTDNYLKSFLAKPEYILFDKLKKESKLTITDLLYIFMGDGGAKNLAIFKDGGLNFPNQDKSMILYKSVVSLKPKLPNKAFVRRSLYKIMAISGDYIRMQKAIEKSIKNYTIFSENEIHFYQQLVQIYKKEFKVK